MTLRRSFVSLLIVSLLAITGATAASAQNNSHQTGLVNISLGDVDLLNRVNLALAANVAATVCPNVTAPVAVLAQQVVAQDVAFTCETSAGDLIIDQALNGPGGQPSAGGNNSRQQGLVNVSVGNVAILNDVNAVVAANIAVTACPNLTIPIAVLAAQFVAQTVDFTCTTAAGPLRVAQSQ